MRKFRVFVAAISDLVPLLGQAGRFSTLRGRERGRQEYSAFSLRLFPDRIGRGGLFSDLTRVKFRVFVRCVPSFENFQKLASEMYKNSGMPYKVMAHYHKLVGCPVIQIGPSPTKVSDATSRVGTFGSKKRLVILLVSDATRMR